MKQSTDTIFNLEFSKLFCLLGRCTLLVIQKFQKSYIKFFNQFFVLNEYCCEVINHWQKAYITLSIHKYSRCFNKKNLKWCGTVGLLARNPIFKFNWQLSFLLDKLHGTLVSSWVYSMNTAICWNEYYNEKRFLA